ncbi:NETWORKED 4B-like protein [Tanacetum coccineum]
MEVVESKSWSPLEGSQISPEISVSLAENVEGFEQCVKEILKLIEQDADFFELTAEIYDAKKSKLTKHVTELSRMHGVLADQHVELIKKQHVDTTDPSSPQVTQMFTPDQMSNTHKFRTPIGFDVMNSGGTGSYASKKDESESSFSLSSDSDSESFMSINKLLISPGNDDVSKVKETKVPEVLLKKIATLEEELVGLNTKIQTLSDENTKLKHEIHEKESDVQSYIAHLETEKAKVAELQKQVSDLKLVISDSNLNIRTTRDELEASRKQVLAAEDEISKLKDELSSKIFEQTNWLQGQLGSTQQEIASLQKQLGSEIDKNAELQEEVSLCVADISVRNDQITELNTMINQSMSEILLLKSTHEAKEDTLNADIGRLNMELREKCQVVEALNKYMDALKLEKDGVKAQLDTLHAEKCHQDNVIRELETRLDSLQVEHVGVLSAQKDANELKLKVAELEREVNMQREVISDRAEEKREAIRQLSFSLEHYMSGYKELRQAFVSSKRHAVMSS